MTDLTIQINPSCACCHKLKEQLLTTMQHEAKLRGFLENAIGMGEKVLTGSITADTARTFIDEFIDNANTVMDHHQNEYPSEKK